MSSSESSETSETSPPPAPRNDVPQDDDSDIDGSSFGLRSPIESSNSFSTSESDYLEYDPTPWAVPYPQPNWFSCRQFITREYGRNVIPGLLNKKQHLRPYNPYWFRKYAYNSLYFIQRMILHDKLEGHNGCVNCLSFNESGSRLCSGSDDLSIKIWDWQSSKLKHSFSSGHTANVFQARWCRNDTHILTCARDGQIRICDIDDGLSECIAKHNRAVHKCTFWDPNTVLTCGEDGQIHEVDLRCNDDRLLLVLRDDKSRIIPLYSIHCNSTFTPHYFAVSGKSTSVRIFDRRFLPLNSENNPPDSSNSSNDSSSGGGDQANPQPSNFHCVMSFCPITLEGSGHCVTNAVYNSTGTKILVSYNDEDLYVFDTKSGKEEGKYRGHRNSDTIKGCSWFGDDFVLSGSDDGYIYGWEKKSEHIVMSLRADYSGAVNCVETHPTLPVIASSGFDDEIKVWQPTSDLWPRPLTDVKERICINIKNRISGVKSGHFDLFARNAIWLVLGNQVNRERLRNLRNQREEDGQERPEGQNDGDGDSGESMDDDSNDGPCFPS